MIKEITELNFPSYATLSEATITENAMGLRTITATVKIDGDITPDFSQSWLVKYDNEIYIHPTRKPQGKVENTSLYTSYDLTFQHWAEYQLKRYFFAEMAEVDAGLLIPDKFNASLAVNLENFVVAFNQVLNYYYKGTITMDLRSATYSTDTVFVSISNTKVWDVLTQMYELFGVTWNLECVSGNNYVIKVGYPSEEIDHIFKYGFDGGLLKVERQVQSSDIINILRGRGGGDNIPYRYFKNTDEDNPSFKRDPDYIPELANVYFSELRDINFRYYVQGWKDNNYRYYSETGEISNSGDYGQGTRRYEEGEHWAYDKGFTATKFDPVEWVKDDTSISEYGEIWGALSNNDDIYPTIQGVTDPSYGRVDQAVDVEQIESDDVEEATETEVQLYNVPDCTAGIGMYAHDSYIQTSVKCSHAKFYVDNAENVSGAFVSYDVIYPLSISPWSVRPIPSPNRGSGKLNISVSFEDRTSPVKQCYDYFTGEIVNVAGLKCGHTYCPYVTLNCYFSMPDYPESYRMADLNINICNIKWGYKPLEGEQWQNTFHIWIKNIWGTAKESGETNEEYADRVWKPILGDKEEKDAKVVFSSGWLSTSEDYEFPILAYEYDDSKTYDGVNSHWRLTLQKSDADLETLGLYVPSTKRQGNAGDYFFFTGIDMPHQYVIWAEKRLNTYKQDELAKVSDIKPTWSVTLDKIRIQELHGGETNALISQIKTGGILRLQDDRLLPSYDTFYVKSKTVKYGKGIYPDLEVTLSDDITPSRGTISTITGQVSALQAQVGSLSNIEQTLRYFGDKVYLRKDGISDESRSATAFYNLVKSGNFTQGRLGGSGWAIYRDGNGKSIIEADKMILRDSLDVTTIVVHQTEYVGGSRIESAASIKCNLVEPIDAKGNVILYNSSTPVAYKCYFDTKQGSVKNLFKVNDVAYSHTFTQELVSLSYYKRKVWEVGDDYIMLSNKPSEVDGDGVPSVDDVIIQYGNYTDTDRQYVKVADVIGGGYERFLEGLDSVYATGKEYFFVGKAIDEEGILKAYRMFVGDKDGEYMEWLGGKLHIKGTLSVDSNVEGQTLEQYVKEYGVADLAYLKEALNQNTTISGGLILTSLISLGIKDAFNVWKTWAGVSGMYDETRFGGGVAAWYGGEMVDKQTEDGETAERPAKSLFRFDGSGYLAGGSISWDSDNTLEVSGTINATRGKIGGFTIGTNVIQCENSDGKLKIGTDPFFVQFQAAQEEKTITVNGGINEYIPSTYKANYYENRLIRAVNTTPGTYNWLNVIVADKVMLDYFSRDSGTTPRYNYGYQYAMLGNGHICLDGIVEGHCLDVIDRFSGNYQVEILQLPLSCNRIAINTKNFESCNVMLPDIQTMSTAIGCSILSAATRQRFSFRITLMNTGIKYVYIRGYDDIEVSGKRPFLNDVYPHLYRSDMSEGYVHLAPKRAIDIMLVYDEENYYAFCVS